MKITNHGRAFLFEDRCTAITIRNLQCIVLTDLLQSRSYACSKYMLQTVHIKYTYVELISFSGSMTQCFTYSSSPSLHAEYMSSLTVSGLPEQKTCYKLICADVQTYQKQKEFKLFLDTTASSFQALVTPLKNI